MQNRNAIRLVIGLIIIGVLASSFDLRAIYNAVISAQIGYLFLAFLIYSVTLLILTIRWRGILSQLGCSLPLAVAFQVFVAGVLLSDLTPAKLGDLFRPLLVKDRIPLSKGAVSVAIDKFADLITVSLLGFSGMALLSNLSSKHLLIAAASIIIIIVFFISSLIWLKRSAFRSIMKRLGLDRLEQVAGDLEETARSTNGLPRLMTRSVLITMVAWFTHAAETAFVAQAFGCAVPIHVLFLLLPLLSTLSLIPITVSGLGLIEGGVTVMLASLGVPPATGMAIALTDRVLTITVHLLFGSRYALLFKIKK